MYALGVWVAGKRVLGGGSGSISGSVELASPVSSCSGISFGFSLGEGDRLD